MMRDRKGLIDDLLLNVERIKEFQDFFLTTSEIA